MFTHILFDTIEFLHANLPLRNFASLRWVEMVGTIDWLNRRPIRSLVIDWFPVDRMAVDIQISLPLSYFFLLYFLLPPHGTVLTLSRLIHSSTRWGWQIELLKPL